MFPTRCDSVNSIVSNTNRSPLSGLLSHHFEVLYGQHLLFCQCCLTQQFAVMQYFALFHTQLMLYHYNYLCSYALHFFWWYESDHPYKSVCDSCMRGRGQHTQTRSCVITTSACWQAACRAEPGSRSAKSDLEESARLRGALMSSLVQWAKRSSSLGRLCSITAKRRRPESVMSGPSPGVGGGNGATNSFCSYLALIHDSRSSLNKQREMRRWWIFSETHLQLLVCLTMIFCSYWKL